MLPPTLLSLLLLTIPCLSHASPQPALVGYSSMHLVPHHTLFLRQLSDLQTFTSNIGGLGAASPITNTGDPQRPFQVGEDTFTDFESAANRSCDDQFDLCSRAANEEGNKGDTKVEDCDKQKQECKNAQSGAQVKDFNSGVASTNIGADPDFPDFDLICDA